MNELCQVLNLILIHIQVAKRYEEVEDLHTKLVAKFPSVNFGHLPKMSLIITEKVLNERKKFLEKVLNLIAKTPKLCSSLPVLEFLEVNKISIKQNQLKKAEPEKPKVIDKNFSSTDNIQPSYLNVTLNRGGTKGGQAGIYPQNFCLVFLYRALVTQW